MRILKEPRIVWVLLGTVLLFTISSCKKAREDVLIKGLWDLQGIYVDTIIQNQMDNLPYWPDGNKCCEYRLDFQDNDVLFGYYLTHDTFNYVTPGKWYLEDYDHIYIKVDNYIDGVFEIKKPTPDHFKLESDANHVRAFDGTDLDTTYTRIEIERD